MTDAERAGIVSDLDLEAIEAATHEEYYEDSGAFDDVLRLIAEVRRLRAERDAWCALAKRRYETLSKVEARLEPMTEILREAMRENPTIPK